MKQYFASQSTKAGKSGKWNLRETLGEGSIAGCTSLVYAFPMEDSANQPLPDPPKGDDVSPWAPGECLCGIPNCAGHQAVNGEIHMPSHPLGYLIVTVPDTPRK